MKNKDNTIIYKAIHNSILSNQIKRVAIVIFFNNYLYTFNSNHVTVLHRE